MREAGREKQEKREERRAKSGRREKPKAHGEKQENCTTWPPYLQIIVPYEDTKVAIMPNRWLKGRIT